MIIVVSCDTFFCSSCSDAFDKGSFMSVRKLDELKKPLTQEDVVILDLKYLPPTDVKSITCPIVILSSVPKFEEAVHMLRLGAKGYGNRMMHPSNLQHVVNTVMANQIWMPPEILTRLINALPKEDAKDEKGGQSVSYATLYNLSDREAEVAELIAKGRSNQEIADTLDITVRTVKAHLSSIFMKTGLRDRLALALKFKA